MGAKIAVLFCSRVFFVVLTVEFVTFVVKFSVLFFVIFDEFVAFTVWTTLWLVILTCLVLLSTNFV